MYFTDLSPYLKREPQVNKEWMIKSTKYLYFLHHIAYCLVLQTHSFVHVLHCIHLLGITFLYNTHLKVNLLK